MLSKLGKYEIRRELGRGAMGIVYEGYDPYIERTVAIKTINKSLIDPSEVDVVLSRFRREAQAAGRLSHPNIVSIYEYAEEGDVAFIAMELLSGIELQEFLNKGRQFNLDEIANLMGQLLDALAYSHEQGVVHRDIKPANILIAKNGSIKIADFGIAKIESTNLTTVGFVLGTPSYMSPEQYIGNAIDGRSDLYSAGVLLYLLLTGERPFAGSNITMMMQKVMHQPHRPASELKPSTVSAAMDEVLKKSLAKHAEQRFQTAAEFKSALIKAVKAVVKTSAAAETEATLKMAKQPAQKEEIDLDAAVAFDMGDFEKRLEEARQEFQDELKQSVIYKEPVEKAVTLIFDFPGAVAPAVQRPVVAKPPDMPPSGLLASLALEAKQSQQSKNVDADAKESARQKIHATLERVLKFLVPFVQHVNAVEPAINRVYRLDARSVFENLKWRGAVVDSRKQNMSDTATLDYVAFSVNLVAPEPVLLKRPWGQFEALLKELDHLKIRAQEDLHEIHRRPRQEWLETHLDPALPVQITFQANYELGKIDVLTRNLADFGQGSFRLEPDLISSELLDELGLYLIGRTDKVPPLLTIKTK